MASHRGLCAAFARSFSSSYSRIAIDKIDILAVANGILYRPVWCGGRGKATGDEPPAFYAILIDPRSGICRAMRAVKGFAMAAASVSKGSRKAKRAFAKSLASKKNSAKGLAWPVRLGRTEVRRKWHRRLSELPSGLSLREMVKCLGEPYASIAFWARQFNYPFTKLRRGRKSPIDWDRVDWSLKNSELARKLNVSGERVRQVRLERRLPPTPRFTNGGMAFRQYVRTHRRRLGQMSIREMIAESGAEISTATAHSILKKRERGGNGR